MQGGWRNKGSRGPGENTHGQVSDSFKREGASDEDLGEEGTPSRRPTQVQAQS